MKRIVLLLLAVFLTIGAKRAPVVTTVILVRHAEKAAPDGDPPLSAAGEARAQELARVLSGVPLDAIYVTQFARTQQTVQPLASARGIKPQVRQAGGAQKATYAPDLAREVREHHAGKTVLIAGHSNTTVDVLQALGVRNPPPIADSQYDDLFVCTLVAGAEPRVVALRYGAPAR